MIDKDKLAIRSRTVLATVTRSSSEGSNSGRFYRPLTVSIDDERRIVLSEQSEHGFLLWPDEAEKLGLALIQASVARDYV